MMSDTHKLVDELRKVANVRSKATATDQKGHYTKVVADISKRDAELMLKAASALEELDEKYYDEIYRLKDGNDG